MKGELFIVSGDSRTSYTLGREDITLGSSAGCGIHVPLGGNLSNLGKMVWSASQATWVLSVSSDFGSSLLVNGRMELSPGHRHPLANGDEILVNNTLLCFCKQLEPPVLGGQPKVECILDSLPLIIGRRTPDEHSTDTQIETAKNEVAYRRWELDPAIATLSRRHVTIYFEGGYYYSQDESRLGAEINGRPFQRERLVYGDRLRVGQYLFEFTGTSLLWIENPDIGRVCAQNLIVQRGRNRKVIIDLDDTRIDIRSGEFIGILGGSGQGKSTLLTALCGISPPTSGSVSIGGVGLHERKRLQSLGVGYVPQDDIVHYELTVGQAMHYSARLRVKLSARQRGQLVDETIKSLGLEPFRHSKVSQLSGGQRKRVSIGIELLAKPRVLFLDEPSSGLDPATESQLMELLQGLAESGMTVICTTHVLQKAYLFTRLMWVHDKKVIFFGSTDRARSFMLGEQATSSNSLESGRQSPLERLYQEVILSRGRKTGPQWEKQLRASDLGPLFIPRKEEIVSPTNVSRSQTVSSVEKLRVLLSRQWRILISDRLNLQFLLAQAIVIGLFIAWLAPSPGLRNFLSVVAVLWFGCSNGAQQIVAELPIFQRERVCGMGINVYLFSKAIFLTLLTFVQCLVLGSSILLVTPYFHKPQYSEEAWQGDERFADEQDWESTSLQPTREIRLTDGTRLIGAIVGKSSESVDVEISKLDGASGKRSEIKSVLLSALESSSRAYADHWVPLKAQRPLSENSRKAAIWLARLFDIQANIVEAGPAQLKDAQGKGLVDRSNRPLRWPGIPVWSVIRTSIGLKVLGLLGVAVVGVFLGLAASALVRSATQAVMWVPLILIPQILFGGFVVVLADMGLAARSVSGVIPSAAAQRIMEVSENFGKIVPFIANRAKVPSFFGADEVVEWKDPKDEESLLTAQYPTLDRSNTAWQNLILDLSLTQYGQRPIEVSSDDNRAEIDQVRHRPDVLPGYRQGTTYSSTATAFKNGWVLCGWVSFCYGLIVWGLSRSQTSQR
ncbi:MAG: ATP-binding cassette domain-containing protein [Verrucomicrobiaceae bacterium]|nr:ATP-binding cassette domain-containing protein [Verrucomicrobiaceae bacterium]